MDFPFPDLIFPDFGLATTWVSLLTLAFLEIVLGVDNIIFISIVAGKLPPAQQRFARNIGLALAMIFRVMLLLTINWIISLKDPVLTIGFWEIENEGPLQLSWKDIILISGGLFLIIKSTLEIHHKMNQAGNPPKPSGAGKASRALAIVIGQIVLIDAVFSFDSILTAVGLVDDVMIMIIAVVISIIIMMLFAGAVTRVINSHPTLQMLALSFLVVIGVILIADGIHQHVSKSIVYSCLAFSLFVEMLNIRLRKKQSGVSDYIERDNEEEKG